RCAHDPRPARRRARAVEGLRPAHALAQRRQEVPRQAGRGMNRVVDFDRPPSEIARADLPRLLGGKGANLTVMAVDLGLPVPPAFTFTTDVCREFLASGWPDGMKEELHDHMARLEELVGRKFGDPSDPLLVSV